MERKIVKATRREPVWVLVFFEVASREWGVGSGEWDGIIIIKE